jgi:anti-sigma B factor antagonist
MPDLPTDSDLVTSAKLDGDVLLATVNGEIDLHSSPELRDVLLSALSRYQPKRIILNLAKVSYMDSSAVAVLVEALQKMRKTGGKVCLTHLQPRVKGLLEIARLDTIFTIATDEEDARKK